jgi:hypothetical protein
MPTVNRWSIRAAALLLLGIAAGAHAWQPLPVQNDPLLRMPGTQPAQGVNLEAPNRCLNCHAGYNQAVEPGFQWMGSMMAQAARDPIYWASLAVAAQDSIWALGNPNATDLCLRCHMPEGWLAGRSDPTNGSLMTASDFDGVHCDFCHQMIDPFHVDTFNGTREGADWTGYWDEAGNTGPGSNTLSQTEALKTLNEDKSLAALINKFAGDPFFNASSRPYSPAYTENSSGQFFVSPNSQKRASFADANGRHQQLYSRHHKSKYFCGTCHDVSNPVLANLGASGLPDSGNGLITEQYASNQYFHVERTFSEFMLSAYGQQGGAVTNPEFRAQGGADIARAASCQDCHMRGVSGRAANKNDAVLRPAGSTEHPNSGLPLHDLSGGNSWITWILASTDPNGPVYDPVNAALLNQGPAVLTLDLSQGESPRVNGAALKAGADRAKGQLLMAATFKDASYDAASGNLGFRILNNTGHKLITGYPEGRRMFVNIRVLDGGGNVIREINGYDPVAGTLRGMPASPTLPAGKSLVESLIYEVHSSSTLTGEDKTFHFVLADGRSKDNRIPPRGFDKNGAVQRLAQPVNPVTKQPDISFFTDAEYAGGYDQQQLNVGPGGASVSLTLYYQGTSREYVEFLRNEINGTVRTLTSPTPSGEAQAYVIQSDPFFAKLKAWGNTMWDLWRHNHGLDGSGVQVAGIVPFAMASATVTPSTSPDADADGIPDATDNCTLLANATQCDSDGDGYGNRCDGDLNNNLSTNAQDTTLYRQQLGQPSVGPTFNKADLNCSGNVNAQDTTLFRQLLGNPPGPSGQAP